MAVSQSLFLVGYESDFGFLFLFAARIWLTCLCGIASMSQKTLIIVPTYNERENLPSLIKRIMAQPAEVEILVVDDNSPDGTGKLADEIARENPMVHVLHRPEKNGLGRDYLAGFQWALKRDY
jgi:dolichol-phosphate mannosyltransferase